MGQCQSWLVVAPYGSSFVSRSELADCVAASLAAKPGAVAAPLPSAPGVTLYKVMGKIFAILEIRRVEAVILKCDPQTVELLREQYKGISHRSHLDRRFWVCVDLCSDVPAEETLRLAGRSYELVCATLTRNGKEGLLF